jgi:hypothetical protein
VRLHELMPVCDRVARYQVLVHATPAVTWEAFDSCDFSRAPLTRILMTLRTLRRTPEKESTIVLPTIERLRRSGFIPLEEHPDQEVVVGVVGRFWRPDSGMLHGLSADAVLSFQQDGFAKAYWNFAVEPAPRGTLLSTETRIQCFGDAARRAFKLYWLLVGPFSGLIRKEMLRMVKQHAEASVRP